MNRLATFVLLLLSSFMHAQTIPFDCSIGGGSTDPHHRSADSLKNRSIIPTKYESIELSQLLTMKYTDTTNQHRAVAVSGYVMDMKEGGKESCNCGSAVYKDTHIYLVKDENVDDASEAIIVEATPRMRSALGTTKQLKDQYLHHHVVVYGYLFCDTEHKQNSTVDAGKGLHWRGSVWEVHPITKIELLD